MSDFQHDQSPTAPANTFESARKIGGPLLALPIVSAILLIIVFGAGLFALHTRSTPTTGTRPTPVPTLIKPTATPIGCTTSNTTVKLAQFTSIANIAMTSATDGWGVGQEFVTPSTTPPHTAIVRFHNCAWQPTSDTIPDATLTSLSMISPTEGWAVGATYKPDPSDPTHVIFLYAQPLMLHYQGDHWQRIPEPAAITFGGGSIHMLSDTEGWLWNSSTPGNDTPPLYHYTNGAWTIAHLSVLTSNTTVVDMLFSTPDDYWIQGRKLGANNQATSILAHYQGGTWSSQTFPATVNINRLTFTSPTDGWAVGSQKATVSGNTTTPYLAHYMGQSWQPVSLPAVASTPGIAGFDQNSITNVWMFSSTEGWAVEVTLFPDATLTFYHYHNGQWSIETPVSGFGGIGETLDDFAVVSPTEGWVTGNDQRFVDAHLSYAATFFVHIINDTWTVLARQGVQSTFQP